MGSPTPGRWALVALAILALPAASCPGDVVDPPDGGQDNVPAQVVVSPAVDTLNWLTATKQLSARVSNSTGGVLTATVTWSSQSSAVASVSSTGLVTAVGVGTATVVAQAGGVSGSATIVVRQVPHAVTKKAGDGQSGAAGGVLAAALEVEVRDQGGALVVGAPLAWSVTAGGGTLSSTSTTTNASGVGQATWRLGSSTGTQSVQVVSGAAPAVTFTATATAGNTPAQVVVSPATDTLNWLSATRQLSAQVLNQSGTPVTATVSWSSQATSIATVSSTGLVTAVGVGTATVVAQAGGVSGSATIVVRQVPHAVTKKAGDGQSGAAGGVLAAALEVEVRDQGGALVVGAPLAWSVTAGGGTLSSTSTTTNASGVGQATWRLGSSTGTQSVQVVSGAAPAVTFTATATAASALSITGVNPAVFREGSTATVTGTGFSATASQNTVTVDGLAATVSAASATSLTITVPTADCRPSRQADLRVEVQGSSATRSVGVAPDTTLALSVGGGWFTTTNCIHLAAGTGSERYVVGVTSTSETPSSLTPVQLSTATGTGLQGAPVMVPSVLAPQSLSLPGAARTRVPWAAAPRAPARPSAARQAHDDFEARWRAEERRLLQRLGSPPELASFRSRAAAAPAAVPAVGDTLPFSVPGSCTSGTQIKGVVRYVGRSGLWVEDVANPVQAFTSSEYKDLDDFYTDKTHAVITAYFGNFVDLDSNQRTVVVLTKEVNKKENTLGFVWGGDLYPKSVCPNSNQGEIFYGLVPDPNGVHGRTWTKSDVASEYPTLIAHEITHVIQLTQMIHGSAGNKATWELEGGATLAEQLVGFAVLGHGPGQDLGSTVYWNAYDSGWYANWAIDMAVYFGFAGDNRVARAPEECSWMGLASEGNIGPCDNGRAVYGVPSTLLRFTLDRFGASKAGGEAALMRELTSSSRMGMANLAAATGDTSTRLLVLFGITMWADGRVWNTLTSWNLYDLFQSFKPTARLQPYTSSAAQPSLAASVRAGSQFYLEWSPSSGHPPTSFRGRSPSGETLPNHMVLWILRVQ